MTHQAGRNTPLGFFFLIPEAKVDCNKITTLSVRAVCASVLFREFPYHHDRKVSYLSEKEGCWSNGPCRGGWPTVDCTRRPRAINWLQIPPWLRGRSWSPMMPIDFSGNTTRLLYKRK
ncbi:hypothetical protein CEXT_445521 [Caerostris extrusa]|uniref:Uncharacterized protein n=1 Tax=Caerostris extrusa TaxID=172846 RepID=A0AAV4PS30_CAEEX|nr:hypothetical protein CEXT_445521 [Caerostris extrusa]